MIEVSVLMTAHNAGRYIRESIASVIHQTHQDWELIIVSDGSTDDTVQIVQSYKDARVRLIVENSNVGRVQALNIGLRACKGRFVSILDADDLALPARLEKQVRFLTSNSDVVLVGSWATFISEKNAELGKYEPRLTNAELKRCLAWSDPFVHSSVTMRKDAVEVVGGYSSEFPYAQDYDLIMKLAAIGDLALVAEHLCVWRMHSKSLSYHPKLKMDRARDQARLARESRKFVTDSVSRRLNRRSRCRTSFFLGGAEVSAGRYLRGSMRCVKAFVQCPSLFLINHKTRKIVPTKRPEPDWFTPVSST